MSDDLEDLPGVGTKTADKLLDSGYKTYESIATESPTKLENDAGVGEQTAQKAITAAREEIDIGGFESGVDVLKRREKMEEIKWGVEDVDKLLGGGIDTQSITEIYGEYGSGKSQVTHQISVNVQLPPEHGGLGQNAIFIDTEDTFRPSRIDDMVRGLPEEKFNALAEEQDVDGTKDDENIVDEVVERTLDRISVAKAFNVDHQILLTQEAMEEAERKAENGNPVGLLIVDSATAHFRAEFTGRGNLAERQQKLNRHLHDIDRFSSLYNASAFITNQIQSNPDSFFGDPHKPIGGNILGHTSNVRIYIKNSKNNKRIVELVDAPALPDGESVMRVTDNGLEAE